ncbi:hypothetical protein [Corynebacterium pygosceleis]|uniref:hypothetical protein n=1 Tax=Corynebacterium pygosceleis TaxID=2800406 RepID=UPI0020034E6B|nr:hypothetical protein [Corynebacterium pygosceleis]MCK7676344.1 hypothetical protein [Corynebacterium pygosceleis]
MDPIKARLRVRAASQALRSIDEERERALAARDECLRDARSAGVSWVQMADDSGLSVGALRKALRRAN